MNIVLLHPEDASGKDRWALRDRRARHVREVLGAGVGDAVRVGLRDGPLGTGSIERIDADRVEITAALDGPAPEPWVDLVLGVPRPKQIRKLVPQVVALGIRSLSFLRTWRVQRPYLASPLLRPEGLVELIEDGLMQAGRTAWPRVRTIPRFETYCHEAEARPGDETTRIVAVPGAALDLANRRAPLSPPITLVVGPEGGLLPREVDRLVRAGHQALAFGPSTLRTDTACVVLIGQLDLIRRMTLPD